MPTYPTWLAGQRITSAMLNSMLPLIIVKPADESVTSSTTLQADNDLVLPVIANAHYEFDCTVIFTALTGADLKWNWSVPSGATLSYQPLHNEGGATGLGNSVLIYSTGNGFADGQGASTFTGIGMKGSLVTGSTGGSLQFDWAQNTSNATATTVKTGSLLKLTRAS